MNQKELIKYCSDNKINNLYHLLKKFSYDKYSLEIIEKNAKNIMEQRRKHGRNKNNR